MQNLVRATQHRSAYGLIFYCYFAVGVLLQIFPPLLPSIESEFGVSHQLAALVMTLFMLPMVLLAVPAGLVVDRFGVSRAGAAGFLFLLLGAGVSLLATTFPLLLLGRAISGVGAAFLILLLLKVCAQTFPRVDLGLALGVFAAGLPAGTGVAFDLLAPLGHAFGWRAAVAAGTLIAASALVVFRRTIGARGGSGATADQRMNVARAFGNVELWRLALTAALGYMAILAFTTWAPSTLVGFAGIPAWLAIFLASLLLLIDIPAAPLWGVVSDRLGRRKPFIVGAFAIYLTGSLLVPPVALAGGLAIPGLILVIALMGAGCAMFFPAALAIPAEVTKPELAGAAYGMFFTAQVFGMMAGPAILGYVLDVSSAGVGFLTMSGLTLGGLLAGLTLRSR